MGNVIEVRDFKKSYRSVQAVKGISFSVKENSLFAFLGPNGAGKSTTIDTLCTLIQPDAGEITINGNMLGREDKKIRKDIGVVYQNGVLDGLLTLKENLVMRGSFYKNKKEIEDRINKVAEITGIEDILSRKYAFLSGGQKRRADIARALIHDPKVLFLDEPTTGLDPKTRESIWNCINNMQKELGMTVFLTTHYMEEAIAADDVVIIDRGRIVEQGSPTYLREKYTKDFIVLYHPDEQALEFLQKNNFAYEPENEKVKLYVSDKKQIMEILNVLSIHIDSFEFIKGNMDDAFLKIIDTEGV